MDESEPLDDTDRRIVEFVRAYRRKHGTGPTDAEGAEHFEWKSGWAFGARAKALIRRGVLRRGPGHRTLDVADNPGAGLTLPLKGLTAAGAPIVNLSNGDPYFNFNEAFGDHENFMVQVRGTSMVDDHIADGDFLVVRQTPTAEDGEIVVCLIDGARTVKRFRKIRGACVLYPANKAAGVQPIRLDPTAENIIEGVLVGVVRKTRKAK